MQSKARPLQSQQGTSFYQACIRDLVQDHREDVADFEMEATSGQDPALKNYALEYLPIPRQHLSLARSLQSRG